MLLLRGLNLMLSELSERHIAVSPQTCLGRSLAPGAEKLQAGLRESFPLFT